MEAKQEIPITILRKRLEILIYLNDKENVQSRMMLFNNPDPS